VVERDLILDGGYTPTYDDVFEYINGPVRDLWHDINSFIQQNYQVTPKLMYSKCSAKPGWNVKYQKSGKSLCTLYPEKEGFVALVVITLDLIPLVKAMTDKIEPQILETLNSSRPFNGTKWLMIQVTNEQIANNLKQLLMLKHHKKVRETC
jgi:hypothetical protein